MESKHTKGPWESAGMTVYTPDVWNDGNCSRGTCIANAFCEGNRELFPDGFFSDDHPLPQTDDEAFANARLIAAAPELLAACKAIVIDLENNGECFGTDDARIDYLKSFINKAEGK